MRDAGKSSPQEVLLLVITSSSSEGAVFLLFAILVKLPDARKRPGNHRASACTWSPESASNL